MTVLYYFRKVAVEVLFKPIRYLWFYLKLCSAKLRQQLNKINVQNRSLYAS